METEVKVKKTYKVNTEAVRVKKETKKKIQSMLMAVNKKDFGRSITPDSLVGLALSLVTSEHLDKLKEQSLTNKDRLEQKYYEYCKTVSKISRDEFYGILLKGEI